MYMLCMDPCTEAHAVGKEHRLWSKKAWKVKVKCHAEEVSLSLQFSLRFTAIAITTPFCFHYLIPLHSQDQ